jgi:hypothetical protein
MSGGASVRLPHPTAPLRHKPRRSAPLRRPRITVPAFHLPALHRPTIAGTVTAIRTLPDHRWLDRIVRGRWWIPLMGVMLAGVVAMQVEVLKLGASVGRSINLSTELQSRNELLRASVAKLSDDQRIERLAAKLGMVMPGPTEVHFVPAHAGGELSAAISNIAQPNADTFLQTLSTDETSEEAEAGVVASSTGTAATAATTNGIVPPAATPSSTLSVDSSAAAVAASSDPGTSTAASTGATDPTSATTTGADSAAGTTDSAAGTTDSAATGAPAGSSGSTAASTGPPAGDSGTSSSSGGAGVATAG